METPVQIVCNHKKLYGILHIPDEIDDPSTIVIIVTGGPQVRIGPHRLYVHLSRYLCEHNWPSLRFDYEGLGDSEGDFVGFQHAESSITAAMNFLQNKFKTKINFILWSLCDGATTVTSYAAMYPNHINGLILCNPLVITEQGIARSYLLHYYSVRLFKKEFLQKLVCFKVDLKSTIKSLYWYIKKAQIILNKKPDCTDSAEKKIPNMVINNMCNFQKPIRIILSTGDIVADNFQDELKKNKKIHKEYKINKIKNHIIKGADHTFVDPKAKEKMFEITIEAINDIESLGSLKAI